MVDAEFEQRPTEVDVQTVDPVAALYEQHADELTRFAATLLGPHDAADAVASVFARMVVRGDSGLANERAYLFRSVFNECMSVRRATKRRSRSHRTTPSTHHDQLEHFDELLAGLSPRQRAVVTLTYVLDLRPHDVAEHLGVSTGTVKKLLARAHATLRERLTGGDHG